MKKLRYQFFAIWLLGMILIVIYLALRPDKPDKPSYPYRSTINMSITVERNVVWDIIAKQYEDSMDYYFSKAMDMPIGPEFNHHLFMEYTSTWRKWSSKAHQARTKSILNKYETTGNNTFKAIYFIRADSIDYSLQGTVYQTDTITNQR